MFGIFKSKKRREKTEKVIMHPELGEMRFGHVSWSPSFKIKITLWDRVYDISLWFWAEDEEEEPTPEQEEAYQKFKRIVVEQRDTIERMIMEYSEEEDREKAGNRMIPRIVEFSRKGECALFFEDKEEGIPYEYADTDAGVALFLIPRFLIDSAEYCSDCMSGYEDTSTREELYGEL